MATRSATKSEGAAAAAVESGDLRLARKVHTLAHVLYGQMTGIQPGMVPPPAAGPSPGAFTGTPDMRAATSPAFHPWMVGMPGARMG